MQHSSFGWFALEEIRQSLSISNSEIMKKYLQILACFFLLLVVVYGVTYGRFLYKMNSYALAIPKEKTVLLIGESQSQAAVDDSKISNLYNSSQAQDRYMSMFCRMRALIEANPHIDTVIISLTPHSINRGKDDFWTNGGYLRQNVQTYGAILGLQEWSLMFRHAPESTLAEIVTPLMYYWKVNESYIKQYGSFSVADYCALQANIDEGATSLKVLPDYGNRITLQYLDKMIRLCESKGIKVIGLNTPVYQAWKYEEPKYFYDYLSQTYPNLELWDYLDADIPDDFRRDINHLNRKGAEWFTKLIRERLLDRSQD